MVRAELAWEQQVDIVLISASVIHRDQLADRQDAGRPRCPGACWGLRYAPRETNSGDRMNLECGAIKQPKLVQRETAGRQESCADYDAPVHVLETLAQDCAAVHGRGPAYCTGRCARDGMSGRRKSGRIPDRLE